MVVSGCKTRSEFVVGSRESLVYGACSLYKGANFGAADCCGTAVFTATTFTRGKPRSPRFVSVFSLWGVAALVRQAALVSVFSCGGCGVGEASSMGAVCACIRGFAEASRCITDNKRVEEARRARVERLERQRRESATEEEFETARTQPIWTQLDSSSCSSSCTPLDPSPEDLQRIHEENRLHFQYLVYTEPTYHRAGLNTYSLLGGQQNVKELYLNRFYVDFEGRLEVGQRIGGGAQADIHEAVFDGNRLEEIVLKVFKGSHLLADQERTWSKHIAFQFRAMDPTGLESSNFGFIHHGTLLDDGRFAFVLQKKWGDLRKAIDLQMVKDRAHQSFPFSHFITYRILWDIAKGMSSLHAKGIFHKDLKAANCLFLEDPDKAINRYMDQSMIKKSICNEKEVSKFWERMLRQGLSNICTVVDFESSEGVVGTGFWRAPEVLLALKNNQNGINSTQRLWIEKADVYSYAMTCYEVLTGCIPFEDHAIYDYDGVIGGNRPPLPDYVDPKLQKLVRRYWHSKPSKRPTFEEILCNLRRFDDLKGLI